MKYKKHHLLLTFLVLVLVCFQLFFGSRVSDSYNTRGVHFEHESDEKNSVNDGTINLSLEGNNTHDIRTQHDHHSIHTRNNIESSYESDNNVVYKKSNLTSMQIQAQKYLTNKESAPRPPNLTLGALIHVGKTGGSTLSSSLPFACHSFAMSKCHKQIEAGKYMNIGNETAVSKLSTYYHVPDFNAGKHGLFGGKGCKHKFYTFTVRDPLARTISSYLYQHPLNQIAEHYQAYKKRFPDEYLKQLKEVGSEEAVRQEYTQQFYRGKGSKGLPLKYLLSDAQKHKATFDCAPTLEDYGMLLGQEDDSNCTRLAKVDISHDSINLHLKYSLTYITSNLLRASDLANKTILAIRTEYLNYDWISSNEYLGQEKGTVIDVGKKKSRDSSAVERPVTSELSEEGRRRICALLKIEYNVYFGILNQAANLGPDDVANSLAVAKKNCPWLEFNSVPQSIDEAFKRQ